MANGATSVNNACDISLVLRARVLTPACASRFAAVLLFSFWGVCTVQASAMGTGRQRDGPAREDNLLRGLRTSQGDGAAWPLKWVTGGNVHM